MNVQIMAGGPSYPNTGVDGVMVSSRKGSTPMRRLLCTYSSASALRWDPNPRSRKYGTGHGGRKKWIVGG
jgi:hypothetical protein